jgi:glycosyltransferase involved in cell wall biosynthesis
MKAVIVAYGHADNVTCLAKNLSALLDVTLIFVTCGKRFTRSIFDWDLRELPFGLTADPQVVRRYVADVEKYLNGRFSLCIARIPSRSIVKDWSRTNVRYVKQIAEYVQDNDFDVVHFNGFSGFQLYFHRYLRRVPKVYTIHDYLPHTGEWKLAPVLLNRLYSKLDYQFIQHYTYLSENFVEHYGADPRRVHTVYCGPLDVYKSFIEKTIREEPSTIMFFGRISPYKGIEYLVEAMRDIRQHIPNVRCIIAGSGDIPVELGNKGEYEVYNYHIPNDEMVDHIQRAAIIVLPYTDATHSAVLMTAYAFHKPVVASAVGGIPEIVEDGISGCLVPPRDSRILATTIVDLLKNKAKRNAIKRNIEKACIEGDFSWKKVADNTLAVYEKALRQ